MPACLLRIVPVAGALALAAIPALAVTHLSPGLWEQQVTVKSDDPRIEQARQKMQDQLAAMPADRRAMMEQMMASKGIGMGSSANSFRVCLTKEQVERDAMPQRDGRCSQQDVSRTGDTMHFKFTCQGRQGGEPMTGEGQFTMNGSTSYTGHTVVTMNVQGRPTQTNSDVTGKWLGSDCGDVKPIQRPAN